MKAKRVKGFNDKEQAIYALLAKDPSEPQSFADMKQLFESDAKAQLKKYEGDLHKDKKQVDAMAQSMARNSVRRLIRDGWAEQCARGTYRLTRTGKDRLKRGTDETPSFSAPKGRPKKETSAKAKPKTKKKAAPKKKKAPAKPKSKTKRKAAKVQAKPKAKAKAKSKTKRKAAKASKGNGVTSKAKEAAKRAKKEAAKEDGQTAAKSAAARVAAAAQEESAAN